MSKLLNGLEQAKRKEFVPDPRATFEITVEELFELADEHEDVAELISDWLACEDPKDREAIVVDIVALCDELTIELDFA